MLGKNLFDQMLSLDGRDIGKTDDPVVRLLQSNSQSPKVLVHGHHDTAFRIGPSKDIIVFHIAGALTHLRGLVTTRAQPFRQPPARTYVHQELHIPVSTETASRASFSTRARA